MSTFENNPLYILNEFNLHLQNLRLKKMFAMFYNEITTKRLFLDGTF